jgi:hypothetical protein
MTKISRLHQAICPLLYALRERAPFLLGSSGFSKQNIAESSDAYH